MLAKKGRARVEPATYWAATNCSTTELTPQYISRGRIAQSVERWSNKPLVMGSIPIVPIFVVFHNRWSTEWANRVYYFGVRHCCISAKVL